MRDEISRFSLVFNKHNRHTLPATPWKNAAIKVPWRTKVQGKTVENTEQASSPRLYLPHMLIRLLQVIEGTNISNRFQYF
jgi:hypothetical protein